MRIHFLHINDVHSALENYCRIGAQLRSLREEIVQAGETCLTFDIGDLLDRVRPETEATMGEVNTAMLAALQVDGWVFGNNEGLTIPFSMWPNLCQRASTSVFGTNFAALDGTKLPMFVDSHIFAAGEVRIGVFGLTANYEKTYASVGARVLPPIPTAKRVSRQLLEAGCDVIVCLSHLGIWGDRKLAAEVPDITLILGGHSHDFMDAVEWVENTAIFQAGRHGLAFGHTIVEFDEKTRTCVRVEGRIIPLESQGVKDMQMLSALRGYLPDIKTTLTKSVLNTQQRLEALYDQESLLANLLVDTLYAAYPVDLGIMMSGALTASLLPGNVTLHHLLGACSTPTRPVLMTMMGEEILSAIEKSLQTEFYAKRGFGFGFRGSVVGQLSLANASAIVQEGKHGRHLVDLLIHGKPVDPKSDYRVVTCEYLWLAPVFEEFRQGRDIAFGLPLVRDVFIDTIGRPGMIERAARCRYQAIP